MKKLVFLLFALMLSTATWAVKAYPFPVTITQPDGTKLTVIGHGDADLHWITTTDGVLLCRENGNFFVAIVDDDGELRPSGQLAHEPGLRQSDELQLISQQDKQKFIAQTATLRRKAAMKREPVNPTGTDLRLFPHTGSPRVLVILAQFSDTTKVPVPLLDDNGKQKIDENGNKMYTFTTYDAKFVDSDAKAVFEEYFNGTSHPLKSTNEDGSDLGDVTRGTVGENLGSVSEYFKDMSFGQFTPQFDLYGPVTLPEKLRAYGAGKSDNMGKFVPAACKAANEQCPDLNFADYDADGDGYVDLVYIIYAGYSASFEQQNDIVCIWPKSGTVSGSTYDGKKIYRYGVNNELNAYPGASSVYPYYCNGIGLFCHEFSHTMGLPDFYPTISSAREDNQALEYWSIMDGGEYVNNGWAPTAYTAWEREAFGWMEIETLSETQTGIEMPTIDKGGKAYRIMNDDDPKEYYIVQNIQQKSWNRDITTNNQGVQSPRKGHGMLVFHVNYDEVAFSLSGKGGQSGNVVNNVIGKPKMTIVPADGLLLTSYKVNNTKYKKPDGSLYKNADYYAQLQGDTYPGTSNVTFLNDESELVNFAPYTSTRTSKTGVNLLNKALQNIREENDIITFDFIADYSDYVTGIKDMATVASRIADNRIYTLNGTQVNLNQSQLPKGVYIVGKKKVVVK